MGLGGKTCSTQLPKGIAGGDVGAGQRSNPIYNSASVLLPILILSADALCILI